MSLWTAHDIAKATNGSCAGTWSANAVAIDSRTVKEGDLFIALKGPNFDGHDFVAGALAAGASGAIVSAIPTGADAMRCVVVADGFQALHDLGQAGRARSSAKILAVTGSVGKTGCKEALRQILSAQAPSYANEGSFNNHWGVPLSLSRLPAAAQYGVFELGMNHMGELGPLSRQVRPDIALITSIAAVHIGNFNSLDEIASAKSEIFEGLAAGGSAVLNADNAYIEYLKQRARHFGITNITTFGKKGVDAKLENFVLKSDGSEVNATILGKKINYTIGAPGEHWVINSLAVLLSAGLAGADVERAAHSMVNLQLAQGRGTPQNIEASFGEFTLIDESYNASPVAVEMAIQVLANKKPSGKRMLALGDMRELGEHSKTLHVNLAQHIIDAKIDSVFCCGEHMKHLYSALPDTIHGGYAFTSAELAPIVANAMRAGDIITIKGSKSVGMQKVVDALMALTISKTKKAG
ncbi:MAG: UDP-N-acetylmuramoyl-tripeptide--D-alanyl-D-alanine ligase [Alphaproteobacteria bacterium]|nr:UDP-N-acetylmuramoyl-tripeptide--D-alanyl-D-alanine ligase [Alphaproteobacteria bacterium]